MAMTSLNPIPLHAMSKTGVNNKLLGGARRRGLAQAFEPTYKIRHN